MEDREMKRQKNQDALEASGYRIQEPLELNIRSGYIRHQRIPCKFCGKIVCDAGQAVVTRSISKNVAYLRSRCCGRNWSLPVKIL